MAPKDSPTEYTTRAWLVIFGAFTCAFCTVGFMNSFGIFQEYYTKNQLSSSSTSTIAWLGAISIFFLFAISVGAGAMLDTFGPTFMVYVGSFGCVFALMMTSLCKEFYQFLLAQGVVLGISMGLVTWPMLALVGQYIKVKRAAAMGIVLAGSSLGGVIWPIAIDRMINNPNIGFSWSMRIVGFVMIPCFIFSCAVARSPDLPTTNVESRNSNQVGDENITEEKDERRNHKGEALALLRKPSLQLLCLAMFITYFGMFSPFFYTTSYAVEKGFSTSLAFYTVSIVNGASFFGRVLPGVIADKYGKFNCCIIATISAGIIALCWTKVTSVAGLIIWSAAYGFASGGILSLQQACAAQVATSTTLGLAIGTVTGSTALSAMANVPISGALVEKYGYLALSMFSGASLLLGGFLLTAARLAQNRQLRAVV
ncbi:Major facilitator superfamily domain, general substrate transporter [Penicillium griseofulvum]|uniref:Major facilitator superfamily domain, general substrate transporter n=1 Tax=Penicillium patulum TaxID=5078 RepID=A0A135LP63_PENPA|nr:Major facilitator superfamily domain, general substrate transporter [Penicillium griseofulvum]KXG50743.1 Major facilitator superfamily domain, general substrate transporter [Penicillium griseofulvum]